MNKLVGVMVFWVLVGGVSAIAPSRSAAADSACKKISGGIISAVTPPAGCTSPVGLCTAGTFSGDGLLNGTTSFTAEALAPVAGVPVFEVDTTLSYTGLLTITTRKGTLTTRDTGIFDTAAGLFSSRDVIVGGTGVFSGATGFLFFVGTGVTEFVSEASGEICLAP